MDVNQRQIALSLLEGLREDLIYAHLAAPRNQFTARCKRLNHLGIAEARDYRVRCGSSGHVTSLVEHVLEESAMPVRFTARDLEG
jgi:hypothetical protein